LVLLFPIEWVGKDGTSAVGYVPTRIVKTVMWVESSWEHYRSDGKVKTSPVNTNGTVDYGIMQISGPANDPTLMNLSWFDNLRVGIQMLHGKWQAQAFDYEDPSIIENWYYPLAAYNGLSLGGANDPSVLVADSIPGYFQSHPDLLANNYTYQDKVLGVLESPTSWGVPANVSSGGAFGDLAVLMTRPYAIPEWVVPGVSWESQGLPIRAFTAEADSFSRSEDTPALQSYGLPIHRWIETTSGGEVLTINPIQVPIPGDGKEAFSVAGWVTSLTTDQEQAIPFAGNVQSPDPNIARVSLVIASPSGKEKKITEDFNPAVSSVSLSQYYFDPQQFEGQPGRYIVGLWVKGTGGASAATLLKTAEVRVTMSGFALYSPLAGYSAFNAPLNCVFDHEMDVPYRRDGRVTAYTGETASGETPCSGHACSYPNPSGKRFVVNGNYTGAGNPLYLWYEGHPGTDFRAAKGVKLYATSAGVVSNPQEYGSNLYNVLQIDHENGYVSQYWHCDKHLVKPGDYVQAGDPVATSGDKGAPGAPHLHFEVRYNGVPVDPYGWTGGGEDPYRKASSTLLWADLIATGGAIPCLTECHGNAICEGEQCILRCEIDGDCLPGEGCRQGICQPTCPESQGGVCIPQFDSESGLPTGDDATNGTGDSGPSVKEGAAGCSVVHPGQARATSGLLLLLGLLLLGLRRRASCGGMH